MKRLLLLVLGLLILVTPANALETNAYTGSASRNSPFVVDFVTNAVGTVTVNVQWTPTATGKYFISVEHLANPSDPYSADFLCGSFYTDYPNNPSPGNWTCTKDNSPSGYWRVRFYPYSGGKVTGITYTITAER